MSRFLSFFVFAFGILLLLVIGFMLVQRWMAPEGARVAQERTIAPRTDLPPLNIGTRDQFEQQLDRYYEAGGISAVSNHVADDLVPGRVLLMTFAASSDHPMQMVIIDREMRSCDAEGSALPSVPPIVARATGDAKMGDDVHLTSWQRLHGKDPSFYINVWWVPPQR